jgi:hypothetical protein
MSIYSIQKQHYLLVTLLCFMILFVPLSKTNAQDTLASEQAMLQENICTEAGPVPKVNYEGRTIYVPGSIEEEKELLDRLSVADRKESTAATIALAPAGNLETFRALLTSRDSGLLRSYALSYRNRDGSKCIDPIVEEVIIQYR